jgi:hypothetical protein
MDGGAFIRDLCIALEHRWKPEELFLLFTAYFDEADTHGDAPPMVMAGFLGHAGQWKIFDRRIKIIQKEEDFDIFHGKEVHSWYQNKAMPVVNALTYLVKKELTEGLCIKLEYERYINGYRKSPTPKGISLDSQYGVCFRFLLRSIVNLLHETGRKHKLHVVVERGDRHALNTERIFHETKQTLKARGIELLGEWTLAAKEEAPPLMVADFLAHTYALMLRPGGIGIAGYADAAPAPRKGDAGLTFLELEADSLSALKLEMQRERWARQAYARAQKERARARPPSSEASGSGDESLC